MTNDEFVEESYEDSYDDITLEDVESYLESMRNDITDAIELHDDMIQEGYEYEDLSLEDVESYIESNIDNYNSGVDLYNEMIQESDDNLTDDIEEGVINKIKAKKDIKKSGDIKGVIANVNNTTSIDDLFDWGDKVEAERRAAGIPEEDIGPITYKRIKLGGKKNKDKSIKESYTLDNPFERANELDMEEPLTAYEFFDESYEPDNTPIVPLSTEGIYLEEKEELTLGGAIVLGSVIGGAVGALIGQGINLIDKLITDKKYGRFPKDMKRAYEIIQSENFEASENKRSLKKAFRAIAKDLRWMLGGFGSRWKVTVNEAREIRKLYSHVNDLYVRGWMLTRNKKKSDKRRVPDRINEFVEQGNKVLKMLNKSVYKTASDTAVSEWMV